MNKSSTLSVFRGRQLVKRFSITQCMVGSQKNLNCIRRNFNFESSRFDEIQLFYRIYQLRVIYKALSSDWGWNADMWKGEMVSCHSSFIKIRAEAKKVYCILGSKSFLLNALIKMNTLRQTKEKSWLDVLWNWYYQLKREFLNQFLLRTSNTGMQEGDKSTLVHLNVQF